MNKKYIIDAEGIINVITDTGECIKKNEKYTKNTDEILALENVIENLENKTSWFEQEIITKINKNKFNILAIIAEIFLIILSCFLSHIFLETAITPFTLSITVVTAIVLIPQEIRLLIKNQKKITKYNKKINNIKQIIKKVKKRIETLSKDKTQIEINNPNQEQDVKNIYNYNFDPSDYFIEKYTTDKRTNEMINPKKKVRKITKEDNTQLLKYKR